ncbi:MAG TPA: hypothetical protein VGC19_12140 [Rhodanobacter sp.]
MFGTGLCAAHMTNDDVCESCPLSRFHPAWESSGLRMLPEPAIDAAPPAGAANGKRRAENCAPFLLPRIHSPPFNDTS